MIPSFRQAVNTKEDMQKTFLLVRFTSLMELVQPFIVCPGADLSMVAGRCYRFRWTYLSDNERESYPSPEDFDDVYGHLIT